MARHKLTREEAANGGKIGGPRRAAKLTKKRRREIALNAIRARWAKAKEKQNP